MNANDIINSFAHRHRCSRFDQQRMIEALILELEELKGLNKTDDYETSLTDHDTGFTQADAELGLLFGEYNN